MDDLIIYFNSKGLLFNILLKFQYPVNRCLKSTDYSTLKLSFCFKFSIVLNIMGHIE